MTSLKYVGSSVVCQEVPDEISLAINISGCPHHCAGCHSTYLWSDIGDPLLDDLSKLLNEYGHMITCVCFMGGDQNMSELEAALKYVKQNNFKTCLYSGVDDIDELDRIIDLLDYCKVGSYQEDLGGLNSKTTNQAMYRNDGGVLINITSRFWRDYKDAN